MKVSVVVPVYNKADYLLECFNSIFGQSYGDFEVIAVDDASTDGSLSLLHQLKDDRLRVVALERNLGHPGATRTGVDLARGEYVIRCDADDISVPDRFARQVEYMDAHPEIGASGCALQLFGASDEIWRYPLSDAECQAQVLFTTPFADGASIIRRSVLLEHGIGFREDWPRSGSDWLLSLDLSLVTRFGNLPEPLLKYRRGGHNISDKSTSGEARREVVRLALRRFGLSATDDEVDIHMFLGRSGSRPPDRKMIKATRDWLIALEKVNEKWGRCPQHVFRSRTDELWRSLFFTLPAHGWAPALTHLWLDHRRLWERLLYLIKVRWSRAMRGA